MTPDSLICTGRRRAAALSLCCALALAGLGCSKSEDWAPPQKAGGAPEPAPIGDFVKMPDANAKAYFVRDVIPDLQASAWRWVNKRPELQFRLASTENRKFAMDFALPEVTFKDTGPITITYYVNGRVLDKVKYTKAGNQKFEKAVPAEWLKKDAPNVVAAEVENAWVSPRDGIVLGFILVSAGFPA